MRNGIIGIIAPVVNTKAIDIKITNTFPLIALGARATLATADGFEDVSEFQHVSVPPDLRLHLTQHAEVGSNHRWLSKDLAHQVPDTGALRALTFVSSCLMAGAAGLRGTWHQAALVSPLADARFDPSVSRIFVDLLIGLDGALHREIAFAAPNMRPAPNGSGNTLGPYPLASIFRRRQPHATLTLTVRWGFVEVDPAIGCVVIPVGVECPAL